MKHIAEQYNFDLKPRFKTYLVGGSVRDELLGNILGVSSKFNPDSEYVQQIQVMVKKLAPRLFSPSVPSLPRTVSFSDVESVNSLAAASTRTRSQASVSGQDQDKPQPKRRKMQRWYNKKDKNITTYHPKGTYAHTINAQHLYRQEKPSGTRGNVRL